MIRNYTHYVCDIPDCLNSCDAPSDEARRLPDGWASIAYCRNDDVPRVDVAIICEACIVKLHRGSPVAPQGSDAWDRAFRV